MGNFQKASDAGVDYKDDNILAEKRGRWSTDRQAGNSETEKEASAHGPGKRCQG